MSYYLLKRWQKGILWVSINSCSFPRSENEQRPRRALNVPPDRLPVSAALRPTIARSHTSSRLPENPTGFSEIRLSGARRGRYLNY